MRKRWLPLIILIAAAFLRLLTLPQYPPGVEHDEVAEFLIAEGIWHGQHALFFADAYGQEPLFLYLVAGSVRLFGAHVLALRWVAAMVGLLTVAAGMRWAGRMFGRTAAVWTAAGLAVAFWPVFWSRVGLRGMLLPLFLLLGADALWHSLKAPRQAYWAGLWLGLSAYTYSAVRALPVFLCVWGLYLLLFCRGWLRNSWKVWMHACVVALVVAAPIIGYLWLNPTVQYRVQEVNAPLAALAQGNVGPLADNIPAVLGMFFVRGDPSCRNNLPGRPVFAEPAWAILFCLGLAVALARFRDPRYGFVLLWLGAFLTPTWATSEAPNFVRSLGALPAIMVLPGIGAVWLESQARQRFSWRHWGLAAFLLVFVVNAGLTFRDYFVRWAEIDEVHFVWQSDLAAIADYLKASPVPEAVILGGLSPNSMDDPSWRLLTYPQALPARWVDPGSPLGAGGALVVPEAGGRLLVPDIVPVAGELQAFMAQSGAQRVEHLHFTEYRLPLPAHAADEQGEAFAGGVRWLAVQPGQSQVAPGSTLSLLSLWEVVTPSASARKIFVHLVDAGGESLAQHDGLDAPLQFLEPGDRIVQLHRLHIPDDAPEGIYTLRIGLYDESTGQRYLTSRGEEFITPLTLQVTP